MNANTYKGRESGNGTPQDIATNTAFNKDFGYTEGTVLEGGKKVNLPPSTTASAPLNL